MAPETHSTANDTNANASEPHYLSHDFRTFSWQMRHSASGPSETDPLLLNVNHSHNHNHNVRRASTAPNPSPHARTTSNATGTGLVAAAAAKAANRLSTGNGDIAPAAGQDHGTGTDHEIEEAAEVFADSDGLYPPNCTWTSDQGGPPRRADPYRNAECNVYVNIHR